MRSRGGAGQVKRGGAKQERLVLSGNHLELSEISWRAGAGEWGLTRLPGHSG